MLRHTFLCVLIVLAATVQAENWPGYEKDNLHQNSSAVSISPAALALKWERLFNNPYEFQVSSAFGDNRAAFCSRNISLVNGSLAIVARTNDTVYGSGWSAFVTAVDSATGDILTCIKTTMGVGPVTYLCADAYDTASCLTVSFWDPETGNYYMANGGDGVDQTAYKLLANTDEFALASAGGTWYVDGIPAFEDFRTSYPGFQDNAGNTAAAIDASSLFGFDPEHWDLSYGGANNGGSNQSGFFELDPVGGYMIRTNDGGHMQGSGYAIINKHTGLTARNRNGMADLSTIEPPVYTPALVYNEWRGFKMWGACMINGTRLYFMGPGDDCSASSVLGDYNDQGLYIGCNEVTFSDINPNDGYTGPGTAESASWPAERWRHRYVSPNGSAMESYRETDGYYRNKAWLLTDDGTVWAAWKPTMAGNVQLIHCGPDDLNDTFDLGVGAGRKGQDVWPHISYVNPGAGEKYIAYYAGNAAAGSAAELAVFDADAGILKWTYILNGPSLSGPYTSLPLNETTAYFDRSQMVIAGHYVYIAWIDLSGTDAALKAVGFDMTAAAAPATPPVPLSHDLGFASADGSKSFVMDLAAADGCLYALLMESDTMGYGNNQWDAQRIVALHDPAASAVPGSLGFAGTALTAAESAGTAEITVQRTGGTDGIVTIDYAAADGSASAGSDYTAVSGTLTWADSDAADKTITVTIDDDTLDEGDETITLTLSAPGGGAAITGANPITLTITDDDSAATTPSDRVESGGCLPGRSLTGLIAIMAFFPAYFIRRKRQLPV